MSLSSSPPPPPARTYLDSKRTPSLSFYHNEADVIEKNMLDDGFRTWGLVIYRCTYKSDSDWEEFMRRFLHHVRDTLEYYDGLDMLDSFVPTVMDDKTRLDGATASIVRDYFNQWARTACETEQGVPFDRAQWAHTARYRLCIMVDEEALQSVLDIPLEDLDAYNETGYVILVNGRWEPGFLSEEELEAFTSPPPENNFEPVLGCTLEDVGWMKVCYDRAQILASAFMRNGPDWQAQYRRPPEITFNF
ncbi:hypothetical protein CNMCM5793_006051 [Aspergillus hiratsukae]|uniref:Uncharacterized protein n=1 Tax=Aspergillus hiratsukae TaxID=1194566 RepID=A0A8H6QH21_9EURO|nr:hypothetical protein CNMCM5793_006051 [Aspergillus hiratsukae]KAF7172838.1 hypothetical protein CNMCM6106_006943 [Aspergillus hiratsukae]